MPSPRQLAELTRAAATELGFVRTGFTRADRFEQAGRHWSAWIARGMHGQMNYLAGPRDRADPRALLPQARTVVVVALPHFTPSRRAVPPPERALRPRGEIAAYAVGKDYHAVVRRKLELLARACERAAGHTLRSRVCVDAQPLLERAAAARAGVALIGHNTMAIVPAAGSRVLLGVLLLDAEIEPDPPLDTSECEGCRACLDACPTGALVAPRLLDARRCISYLTIEHPGAIPLELRPLIGRRVFGCDACQTVCPLNSRSEGVPCDPALEPTPPTFEPDLAKWVVMGTGEHRRLVKGTALCRASRPRLARNAAVALGNLGGPVSEAALAQALDSHSSSLVRAHAAWGLGRTGTPKAVNALLRAQGSDRDPSVRAEAASALDHLNGRPADT